MTTYRGMDGFFSIGGILTVTAGGVLVNGALIATATTLNLDGTGLQGVVMKGDTFTLGGEAGSPVHTVTNTSPLVASAGAIAGITFTPAIAGGGVADNAVITYVSNAVLEIKMWSTDASMEVIDTTKMGDKWKGCVGGIASWSGQGTANLDYGDVRQKTLIDKLLQATPAPDVPGVLFGTNPNKQWYGASILSGLQITGQLGAVFQVQFSFTGNGPLLPNWN